MPALDVIRYSSMMRAARRALHRSITTVVPPPVSGRSSPSIDATCPAGNDVSVRTVGSLAAPSPVNSVSCVCCTPFGRPIDPDV